MTINEINDIIDAVIIPFVVERPYEVSGDFYMSSSNINKINFNGGQKMNLWHKKTPLVIALIHALYELPGCACGGIAHVLIDDENVTDSDIIWMTDKINSDDKRYVDSIERDLVELLCKELSQMTFEQRLAIFKMMELGIDNEELYKEYETYIQYAMP